MLASARSLDNDQRQVFDIIIKYCKDLRKSGLGIIPKPKPPLLKVHGGAGCGKSKLIHVISEWAEYCLRTSSDRHPDHPYVVKVAPTGKAASLIGGLTLHSAFNFSFGNEYSSLSDSMREAMRSTLSELTILIVDEMSMLKSDMLYHIHLRL